MSQTPKRRVNRKAVLILTAAAAALGVTVHLVHGYQIKRHAPALLEQATEQEREGQLAQAADTLSQYLGMVPSDTDALARYGLLLGRQARTGKDRLKAFFVLEQVLRRDGNRHDVRRRAAELATAAGRFGDARHHLEALVTAEGESAELLQLLARCDAGTKEFDKASERLVRAAVLAPANVEVCEEHALLLRTRLGEPGEGDRVMEELVGRNKRLLAARLAAARYFLRFALPAKAAVHVEFVLKELAPQDADALLMAAEAARARRRPAEARGHLERGLKAHPADTRLSQALARLEVQEGRPEQALQHLQPQKQALSNDPQELWQLGDLLTDAGDLAGAGEVIKRLREAKSGAAGDYLEARGLMKQKAWAEARNALERARLSTTRLPELARRVDLMLAECFGRLGNPDESLKACNRALQSDPQWLPGRRGLAAALTISGKLEQAAAEYRKLVAQAPELRSDLARLLMRHNLRLPEASRRWADVEAVLDEMTADPSRAAEARLLRAQVRMAQGKFEEARVVLETERDRDPKQAGPWLALADLARRQGKTDAVLPLVEEGERHAGKRVEWELARTAHWARAAQAEARRELAKIEQRLAALAGAEQDTLRAVLAEAYAAAGDAAAAERLWGQLAKRQKGNLDVRFALLTRAVEAEREPDARSWLEELRRIEGGKGAFTAYGEAALHVLRARKGNKEEAAAAHRRLREAAALRPTWSQVPLLRAQLYDRDGDREQAVVYYRAAVERGEGRLEVVRRLSQLLYQQGRLAEASTLLQKLPDRTLGTPGMGMLAAQLTVVTPAGGDDEEPVKRYRRALEQARRAVSEKSSRYEYLWLGELAALAEEPREAEKAFRKARQLGGDDPGPWVALVRFLGRTNVGKADAELEAATKLPAEKAARILAPCYEALGRTAKAEKQYRAALTARPNDHVLLAGLAALYDRMGRGDKEEPCLRKLLDPKTGAPGPSIDQARRQLAVLLAGRGGVRPFREALALVEEDVRQHGDTFENRFLRAKVLATQPGRRDEAITLLAKLSASRPVDRNEVRFLLAKLYETVGDWRKARLEFRSLIADKGGNTVYLAHYVRSLLREGENEEAQVRVDALAALGRRTPETALLQVRVLHAHGRGGEAVALVKTYAAGKGARPDVVGEMFALLGESAEAEKAFRAHAAANPGGPAMFFLARHLAGHGRLREALALCERAWQDSPPEMVAAASVAVLQTGQAGEEQRARVERRINDAIRKHPDRRLLLVSLASLAELRGRYAEARGLYAKLLRQDPANAPALNNLAFLMALADDNPAEAARLVEKALEVAGPQAALLDTQALVHLRANRTDLAIRALRQAILQFQSPTYYFHLARCHSAAGDRSAALRAWRRAVALGLKPGALHLLEKPAYKQLAEELGGS